MFRTIMVGVDGSKYAEKAFETAAEMAKQNDAKLYIVTINAESSIPFGDEPPYRPKVSKELEEKIAPLHKKYADKAKDMGVKVVDTKILPVWNEVGAGFVTEAEKQGCALSVIGSRGRTGVSRALLGSVADYVVKHAHCPVLVVR